MRKALILWRFNFVTNDGKRQNKKRKQKLLFHSFISIVAFYGMRFLLYKYVCVCARVVISLSLFLSLNSFLGSIFFLSLRVRSLVRSFTRGSFLTRSRRDR